MQCIASRELPLENQISFVHLLVYVSPAYSAIWSILTMSHIILTTHPFSKQFSLKFFISSPQLGRNIACFCLPKKKKKKQRTGDRTSLMYQNLMHQDELWHKLSRLCHEPQFLNELPLISSFFEDGESLCSTKRHLVFHEHFCFLMVALKY